MSLLEGKYGNDLQQLSSPSPSLPSQLVFHPPQPTKILDAPDMLDDYYLNLIDWSCSNKVSGAPEGIGWTRAVRCESEISVA